MARPSKQGADYFPLDVYLDDKFKFVEIKYKLEGFAIVIKLFQKIYSYGYWYRWTDDEALLFSDEIRADYELVSNVVNECLAREIFSKDLHDKYQILTSKGIQKRYKEIVRRRKDVEVIEEYLLIDNIIGVNDGINSSKCKHDDGKSTQSKVKESKVNKTKENNINNSSRKSVTYDETSIYYQLATYFFERIKENNPDHKEPNFQTWSNDIRKTIELDRRTEDQVKYLMKWVQQDDFEKVNVLSPDKLRKRFDQLVMKVKADKSKQPNQPQKLISTERPAHLKEPEVPDDIDEKIEEALKDLPY